MKEESNAEKIRRIREGNGVESESKNDSAPDPADEEGSDDDVKDPSDDEEKSE